MDASNSSSSLTLDAIKELDGRLAALEEKFSRELSEIKAKIDQLITVIVPLATGKQLDETCSPAQLGRRESLFATLQNILKTNQSEWNKILITIGERAVAATAEDQDINDALSSCALPSQDELMLAGEKQYPSGLNSLVGILKSLKECEEDTAQDALWNMIVQCGDCRHFFAMDTHSTNAGAPIFLSDKDGGNAVASGKPDLCCLVYPQFLEIKAKSKDRDGFECLNQAVERVSTLGMMNALVKETHAFATNGECFWHVSYRRPKICEPPQLTISRTTPEAIASKWLSNCKSVMCGEGGGSLNREVFMHPHAHCIAQALEQVAAAAAAAATAAAGSEATVAGVTTAEPLRRSARIEKAGDTGSSPVAAAAPPPSSLMYHRVRLLAASGSPVFAIYRSIPSKPHHNKAEITSECMFVVKVNLDEQRGGTEFSVFKDLYGHLLVPAASATGHAQKMNDDGEQNTADAATLRPKNLCDLLNSYRYVLAQYHHKSAAGATAEVNLFDAANVPTLSTFQMATTGAQDFAKEDVDRLCYWNLRTGFSSVSKKDYYCTFMRRGYPITELDTVYLYDTGFVKKAVRTFLTKALHPAGYLHTDLRISNILYFPRDPAHKLTHARDLMKEKLVNSAAPVNDQLPKSASVALFQGNEDDALADQMGKVTLADSEAVGLREDKEAIATNNFQAFLRDYFVTPIDFDLAVTILPSQEEVQLTGLQEGGRLDLIRTILKKELQLPVKTAVYWEPLQDTESLGWALTKYCETIEKHGSSAVHKTLSASLFWNTNQTCSG